MTRFGTVRRSRGSASTESMKARSSSVNRASGIPGLPAMAVLAVARFV